MAGEADSQPEFGVHGGLVLGSDAVAQGFDRLPPEHRLLGAAFLSRQLVRHVDHRLDGERVVAALRAERPLEHVPGLRQLLVGRPLRAPHHPARPTGPALALA